MLPGTVDTEVRIVVVRAVVEVETVDTTVFVKVVEKTPPNGANLSIVESGFMNSCKYSAGIIEGSLKKVGSPTPEPPVAEPNSGSAPTIQPLVSEVMYTDVRIGGAPPNVEEAPIMAGDKVTKFQPVPSQCIMLATSTPG
jgi:hypothetical protein